MSIREQAVNEIAKSAPPNIIAWLTLNNVLISVSIGYVILQAAYLIWKWHREYKAKR